MTLQGNLLEGWREPDPQDNNELFTPPGYFFRWHNVLRFTVDAFSCQVAAKLPRYWNKGQNALVQPWRGERVYSNPPYDILPEVIKKTDAEMMHGGCDLVLQLLPGTRAEQPWFQDFIEPFRDGRGYRRVGDRLLSVNTLNVRQRIVFGTPENPTAIGLKGTGKFPSVLVLWSFRNAEFDALVKAEGERA